jgi:hypothetical protein
MVVVRFNSPVELNSFIKTFNNRYQDRCHDLHSQLYDCNFEIIEMVEAEEKLVRERNE